MTRITKGILAQILVTACILMQVVVMLPHHHHDGSSAPCINLFHCGDGCSDSPAGHHCGCGADHGPQQLPADNSHHHDTEGVPCSITHLDVIRLEREEIAGPTELAAQMMAAQAIHICQLHDSDAIECYNTITQLDRKRLRVDAPLHTSYIVAATPPRAPSFTV